MVSNKKYAKFENIVCETIYGPKKSSNGIIFSDNYSNLKRDFELSKSWLAKSPAAPEPYYYHACLSLASGNYQEFLKSANTYLFIEKKSSPQINLINYYLSNYYCYHEKDAQKSINCSVQIAEHAQVKVERTPNNVVMTRWVIDQDPPPTYKKVGGFSGNVDRWQIIDFAPPAFLRLDVGATPTGTGAPEGKRVSGISMRNLNAITPETETTTHYFLGSGASFRR